MLHSVGLYALCGPVQTKPANFGQPNLGYQMTLNPKLVPTILGMGNEDGQVTQSPKQKAGVLAKRISAP